MSGVCEYLPMHTFVDMSRTVMGKSSQRMFFWSGIYLVDTLHTRATTECAAKSA